MNKTLILFLLSTLAYTASAQESTTHADTILVGSIEKNYPGGFESFNKYIISNVRPPAIAFENRKTGTTYVSFIIERDATVSHACTILAAGFGMDEEVIRVISNSNNWIPLTIDNKPVRCFCRVAVQFFGDFDKHEMWIRPKKID